MRINPESANQAPLSSAEAFETAAVGPLDRLVA